MQCREGRWMERRGERRGEGRRDPRHHLLPPLSSASVLTNYQLGCVRSVHGAKSTPLTPSVPGLTPLNFAVLWLRTFTITGARATAAQHGHIPACSAAGAPPHPSFYPIY
ncbi:unnamed protein product [Pleuronectes platessa]|uniref:Uncharacterized protein n=1 Tax=Pleuronectes platessa TaxID=8262 RepID=A0A9N7VM33_PLEPL|nr:unnamed protein product [Pleuronectes platessa]